MSRIPSTSSKSNAPTPLHLTRHPKPNHWIGVQSQTPDSLRTQTYLSLCPKTDEWISASKWKAWRGAHKGMPEPAANIFFAASKNKYFKRLAWFGTQTSAWTDAQNQTAHAASKTCAWFALEKHLPESTPKNKISESISKKQIHGIPKQICESAASNKTLKSNTQPITWIIG